jgi:ATP-binding cassette subfamily B multidrug efflux pump
MRLFAFFERLLEPTALSPDAEPPTKLWPFYWFYARQAKGLVGLLFITGSLVALLDLLVPIFIGRVVRLVTESTPEALLRDHWQELAGMAAVQLFARPIVFLSQNLLVNQALVPGLTNLIRWQNHWHVVRQSWAFFQNDFAGRIANRILQTGPSLRESVIVATSAVWYVIIYGSSAMAVLATSNARLALPVAAWFAVYIVLLRFFVPRMRERSRAVSEMRSVLTGRIVDSYTNILTVKLFARPRDEDEFIRLTVDEHTDSFRRSQRLMTTFQLILTIMNAILVVSVAATAISMWAAGRIDVGTVAMALPLTWQIVSMSGWVAQSITSIFENVGTVQDGMKSIAVPRQMQDKGDAKALTVTRGEVRFEDAYFGYGTERGVLHGISLTIKPGERIGLVGPSGAGKSTMVNVLLRFFELDRGRILIDGQDIAEATQDSLRANIAMVTQDTSLLHRSIRDNIRYGRPEATDAEIQRAAEQAHAAPFIPDLEDSYGRKGYDAQVGERGVKLSGGQRQRIALARVILKDAPILVLDEATSALDSEVEAAIQEQLGELMEGRTVIAIAHRLSTIARMDRLVVMDDGRIVETGTHAELLARGGVYARLWAHQSGGFA